MKYIDIDWRQKSRHILHHISILLVIYSILRFLFYIFNYSTYAHIGFFKLISYFFIGIRFDIASILLISSWWILYHLIPIYFPKWLDQIARVLFIGSHFIFILVNTSDIEYFQFTGTRLNFSLLQSIAADLIRQLDQFMINYWYYQVLNILVFILFWKSLKPIQRKKHSPNEPIKYIVFSFTFILMTLIGARGGLQKKVLQPAHAFLYAKNTQGVLILNSTFTLIKSKTSHAIEEKKYYPNWQAVKENLYLPKNSQSALSPNTKKENVVILILESFATEFWGAANKGVGYTPFLDTLTKKGLFFQKNFANGRKSIEALPSIVLSFPSLMDRPLANSSFQVNQWVGLGSILKEHSYNTSFFHAAEKGSMYFDNISQMAGLDDFYPLERYPNQADYDGHWGIFDEPYLNYVADELTKKQEPFASVVFTLSSHQPYPIPEKYKGIFKKGPTPLHESIGYVDHALKVFFNKIQSLPWFKNTLFIITADHTQMSPSITYDSHLGRYMVPLLFFHPGKKLNADSQQITQQVDIMPSILDYLGIYSEKNLLFGRSIFDDQKGHAIFYQNNSYTYVEDSYALEFNTVDESTSLLYFTDSPNNASKIDNKEIEKAYLKKLKAYIQYYNNGLINNSLYK